MFEIPIDVIIARAAETQFEATHQPEPTYQENGGDIRLNADASGEDDSVIEPTHEALNDESDTLYYGITSNLAPDNDADSFFNTPVNGAFSIVG